MIEKFLMKLCVKLLGLQIKHYRSPLSMGGWRSWIETRKGTRIAFICRDSRTSTMVMIDNDARFV